MARESIGIDPMESGRKGAKETVGFDEPPEVVVIVTLSIKQAIFVAPSVKETYIFPDKEDELVKVAVAAVLPEIVAFEPDCNDIDVLPTFTLTVTLPFFPVFPLTATCVTLE